MPLGHAASAGVAMVLSLPSFACCLCLCLCFCCGFGFRGRDVAPAGDLPFGTAQKGGEKAAPCCLRPFASLRGNLRQPGSGVRRVTRCALCKRFTQTDAASQSTKLAVSCGTASHPRARLAQAQPKGGSRERTAGESWDEICLQGMLLALRQLSLA